jgi:hypothetical protein
VWYFQQYVDSELWQARCTLALLSLYKNALSVLGEYAERRKKINFGTKLKIFKIIPLYPRPDGINKKIAHDSVPLKLNFRKKMLLQKWQEIKFFHLLRKD